jgi:hypothetical protein
LAVAWKEEYAREKREKAERVTAGQDYTESKKKFGIRQRSLAIACAFDSSQYRLLTMNLEGQAMSMNSRPSKGKTRRRSPIRTTLSHWKMRHTRAKPIGIVY